MNQKVIHSPTDAQIEIQERQVVLLFPNQPAVNFSLDIPDLRCAGYSPTYTYKAWLWCAYINALHTAKIKLGYERNKTPVCTLVQKSGVLLCATVLKSFSFAWKKSDCDYHKKRLCTGARMKSISISQAVEWKATSMPFCFPMALVLA